MPTYDSSSYQYQLLMFLKNLGFYQEDLNAFLNQGSYIAATKVILERAYRNTSNNLLKELYGDEDNAT